MQTIDALIQSASIVFSTISKLPIFPPTDIKFIGPCLFYMGNNAPKQNGCRNFCIRSNCHRGKGNVFIGGGIIKEITKNQKKSGAAASLPNQKAVPAKPAGCRLRSFTTEHDSFVCIIPVPCTPFTDPETEKSVYQFRILRKS